MDYYIVYTIKDLDIKINEITKNIKDVEKYNLKSVDDIKDEETIIDFHDPHTNKIGCSKFHCSEVDKLFFLIMNESGEGGSHYSVLNLYVYSTKEGAIQKAKDYYEEEHNRKDSKRDECEDCLEDKNYCMNDLIDKLKSYNHFDCDGCMYYCSFDIMYYYVN